MKNGKKGIIALAALASLAFFASCNGKKYDVEGAAKRVMVNEDKSEAVTADFTVPRTVTLDGNTFNVDWSSNNEYAKVSSSTEDAKYLIDIDYINNRTQAQDVTLTATVSIEGYKQTVTKTFGFKIPKFVLNTIAEADAANSKTNLTLKGVIVAKEAYSSTNKGTNVYLKCDGGGFEAYKLSCTEDQYKKELEVGNTIYVSGPKSYYNGLRELSGCSYIYDDKTAKQTLTATDLTDKLGSITTEYQCNLVKFTNVEIVSIDTPDKDGQYSIVVGDPTDATKQDVVRVSKYFFTGKNAEDYAFKDLNLVPGQKITATGFLGWYNKAQLTLTKAEDLVAGEVNYGSGLASAYQTAGTTAVGAQVVPLKTIDLPSRLEDLGLTGDNYKNYTVEWTTDSTVAEIKTTAVAAKDEVPATETEPAQPAEAAYTKYSVVTKQPTEDTDVTLTVTVRGTEDNSVSTRTVTFKLLEKVEYNTHAEFVEAEKDAELYIQGTIFGFKSNKKEVYIQDADGNGYYAKFDKAVSADWLKVGNKVGLFGKKAVSYGVPNLGSAVYIETIAENQTCTIADYTEEFTTNGFTAPEKTVLSNDLLFDAVTFNGVVKSVNGNEFVITVGEKDIIVYCYCTAPSFGQNDKVKVTGLLGEYVSMTGDEVTAVKYQVFLLATEHMESNATDSEKVADAIKVIKAQFSSETYKQKTDITLTNKYGSSQIVTITSEDGNGVTLDKTALKVTITPTSTEQTYTLTFTVKIGEVTSEEQTVVVKSQASQKGLTDATDFSGNSSTAYNVATASIDVAKLGLSSDVFTAAGNKNSRSAGNSVYVNGTQLRLYQDDREENNTGDGTQITISAKSGWIIDSVNITFADGKANSAVYSGNSTTALTAASGVYTINATSFTIKDIGTGQVKISSMVITYSAA